MEEEKPTPTPTPEEPQITLTIPHDAAVAIGAATINYRTFIAGTPEMASTIAYLDEVYHLIVQQPQLSTSAKAFLRETRLMVTGLKDEGA